MRGAGLFLVLLLTTLPACDDGSGGNGGTPDAGDDRGDDRGDTGAMCGNNVVEGSEACDGDDTPCGEGRLCTDRCTCEDEAVDAICGDNVRNTLAEECDGTDPGFCDMGESCSDACLCVGLCGNGVIDGDEDCDPAQAVSSCSGEREECTDFCECAVVARCGDGLIEGDETCEPGVDEGACFFDESCSTESCQCESLCGNGEVDIDAFEDCDPGEAVSSCLEGELCEPDFCYCVVPYCGDGFIEGEEECDFDFFDGTPFGDCLTGSTPLCHPDTCLCTDSVCGDGEITSDEECDFDARDGDPLGDCGGGTPLCDPASCDCTAAVCGDGEITGGEGCEVDDSGEPVGCIAAEPLCLDCLCQPDSCPSELAVIEADDVQVGETLVWGDERTLPSTTSLYDPTCEPFTGSELMYHFTVPAGGAGTYLFTTDTTASRDSGVNTVLEVRRFCNQASNVSLGCSDDVGASELSRVVVDDLTEGDEMYILVDGWSSSDNGLEVGVTWGLVVEGAQNDPCGSLFSGCGPGLVCVDSSCQPDSCDPLTPDAAPAPVDGVVTVSGTFPDAASALASCGEAGGGSERVYTWTVPETGTWLFTSDTETTRGSGADTVLAIRTLCSAAAPLEAELGCNDEGPSLVSTFQAELEGDDELFVVVDSFDPTSIGADFEVEWGLVQEVGDGQNCDGRIRACEADLVCVDGQCEASVAPDIDALTVLQAQDPTVNLILVEGADPNQDVESMLVIANDALGEELGSLNYTLDETVLTLDGDDFAIHAPVFLAPDSPAAEYEITVVDADGNSSVVEPVDVTATPSIGDDCAPPAFAVALTCEEGALCVVDPLSDLGGTCAAVTGAAPSLTSAAFAGFSLASEECDGLDALSFAFEGTADAQILGFTFQADVFGADTYVFDVRARAGGTFAVDGFLCLDVAEDAAGIATHVGVVDAAGRRSDALTVNIPRDTGR